MKKVATVRRLGPILVFLLVTAGFIITSPSVQALSFINRSLYLPVVQTSAVTSHKFSFEFPSSNSVGSVKFEYCTSPLFVVACSAPAGIDASSVVLSSQTGETGFSIFSASANAIIIGRVASVTGSTQNSYTFSNITNPSTEGQFFARITSYGSSDGTGSVLDEGAVVGVLVHGVTISTEVPPILSFCTGLTIPSTCSSATGALLQLGNFSPNSTAKGTSQFMVGTNAAFGYGIRVYGNTITSGNNTISAIAAPAASSTGKGQFGINLRANSNPSVGIDPSGGTGAVASNYNSQNRFMYKGGDLLASSFGTTVNRRFTVSYIVNIASSQPVGVYNTTLTYTCTATF